MRISLSSSDHIRATCSAASLHSSLCSVLKDNKSLRELSLSGNKLGGNGGMDVDVDVQVTISHTDSVDIGSDVDGSLDDNGSDVRSAPQYR